MSNKLHTYFLSFLIYLLTDDIADTTVDRFPIVRRIVVGRGILAGGANITIEGDRMDEYPVLGARLVSGDQLPELYAYAVPTLRFTMNVFRFAEFGDTEHPKYKELGKIR